MAFVLILIVLLSSIHENNGIYKYESFSSREYLIGNHTTAKHWVTIEDPDCDFKINIFADLTELPLEKVAELADGKDICKDIHLLFQGFKNVNEVEQRDTDSTTSTPTFPTSEPTIQTNAPTTSERGKKAPTIVRSEVIYAKDLDKVDGGRVKVMVREIEIRELLNSIMEDINAGNQQFPDIKGKGEPGHTPAALEFLFQLRPEDNESRGHPQLFCLREDEDGQAFLKRIWKLSDTTDKGKLNIIVTDCIHGRTRMGGTDQIDPQDATKLKGLIGMPPAPLQHRAEPNKRAEPKRAEPKRAEPKRAEPKRAEPERAEPESSDSRGRMKYHGYDDSSEFEQRRRYHQGW